MEIEGVLFTKICKISAQLDANGNICEFHPGERDINAKGLRLNRYGEGPFCKFKIPNHHPDIGSLYCSGVYALVDQANTILYIGKCAGGSNGTLVNRFNSGYGSISLRNLRKDGQSTNCRINNLVLSLNKEGHSLDLFFHRTPSGDCAAYLEADLLSKIQTPWNKSVPTYSAPSNSPTTKPEPQASEQENGRRKRGEIAESVRREVLHHWFNPARNRGEQEVSIVAGDVQKHIGLQGRLQAVCNALLDSTGKLASMARVELIEIVGPEPRTNPRVATTFVYQLL